MLEATRGSPGYFPCGASSLEAENRILIGSHWAIQLFLCGLAYGTFYNLYSSIGSPHEGSKDLVRNVCYPLYLDMPAPEKRHQRRRQNRYNVSGNDSLVVSTDHSGQPVRSRTPRGQAFMSASERRMDEVSRNLARLLRHLPKKDANNPFRWI